MPSNVVLTKKDELAWNRAKMAAEKQGQSSNYALIMHIYKKIMGGLEKGEALAQRGLLKAYQHRMFEPNQRMLGIEGKPDIEYRSAPHRARSPAGRPTLHLFPQAQTEMHLKPPGSGWEPIPKGKRGGYRKRRGAGFDYWYPGKGITELHHEDREPEPKKEEAPTEPTKILQAHTIYVQLGEPTLKSGPPHGSAIVTRRPQANWMEPLGKPWPELHPGEWVTVEDASGWRYSGIVETVRDADTFVLRPEKQREALPMPPISADGKIELPNRSGHAHARSWALGSIVEVHEKLWRVKTKPKYTHSGSMVVYQLVPATEKQQAERPGKIKFEGRSEAERAVGSAVPVGEEWLHIQKVAGRKYGSAEGEYFGTIWYGLGKFVSAAKAAKINALHGPTLAERLSGLRGERVPTRMPDDATVLIPKDYSSRAASGERIAVVDGVLLHERVGDPDMAGSWYHYVVQIKDPDVIIAARRYIGGTKSQSLLKSDVSRETSELHATDGGLILRKAQAQPQKPEQPAPSGSSYPPAGFSPIPHSRMGGYHKKQGTGFIYWYPGQGVSQKEHEADASASPDQRKALADLAAAHAKGAEPEKVQKLLARVRDAHPSGPHTLPPHAAAQYEHLKAMHAAAEEKKPGAKPEPEKAPKKKEPAAVPTVKPPKKVKLQWNKFGSKTMARFPASDARQYTHKLWLSGGGGEWFVRLETPDGEKSLVAARSPAMAKKLAAERVAQMFHEEMGKEKSAPKAKIWDPKQLPEGFNQLGKQERADLTADWERVNQDLSERYSPRAYHGDLRAAVSAHIEHLKEHGYLVPGNAPQAEAMMHTQIKWGEAAGIPQDKLAALLEENVRKLAHQEAESMHRTLGDHGVRHLAVNVAQTDKIFDALDLGGMDITLMQRFMATQVHVDHDMGYTIGAIALGGFSVADNYHPQASANLVEQQAEKYKALFGDQYPAFHAAVRDHSGIQVDWQADPFGSAIRLADNTHLFADKMPEVLMDSRLGVEIMAKIKIAIDMIPATVEEGGKMKRTPEDKARFNSLVGTIRDQMRRGIEARDDLPRNTKEALLQATQELGEMTPKFLISRLAGRSPEFAFDGGDMQVTIEQSAARKVIGEIFGDDETDKQFGKLLKDYGAKPEDALGAKPPPPHVHIGKEGSGINFTWQPGKGDNPTEQRHADVMGQVSNRWKEVQAMSGKEREAAEQAFFHGDVAKSMRGWIDEQQALAVFDRLEKAGAMYVGPRGGQYSDAAHTIPWKESAKELHDHSVAKAKDGHEFHASQDGLYYRAYLRAVRDGNEEQTKHLGANYAGAKKARSDLIDHAGGGKVGSLSKSAMAAVAARHGVTRPSGIPTAADVARPTLGQKVATAFGRRPSGPGWQAVEGKHGGMKRMTPGGRWEYWYPGMGKQGGSQAEAEKHLAKKQVEHHDKKADWHQAAGLRAEASGRHEDVQYHRDQKEKHWHAAGALRAKHGLPPAPLKKAEESDMSKQAQQMETELRKGFIGCESKGESVFQEQMSWTYQFAGPLRIDALQCVKDLLDLTRQWATAREGRKDWDAMRELAGSEREAIRKQYDSEDEEFEARVRNIKDRMKALEAKQMDIEIQREKQAQDLGKSEAAAAGKKPTVRASTLIKSSRDGLDLGPLPFSMRAEGNSELAKGMQCIGTFGAPMEGAFSDENLAEVMREVMVGNNPGHGTMEEEGTDPGDPIEEFRADRNGLPAGVMAGAVAMQYATPPPVQVSPLLGIMNRRDPLNG